MDIINWLNKPYPLLEKAKDKLILAFGFAVFSYIFLLIYEPFGAEEIKNNKSVFLLGFGVCVLLGLLINYLLLPKLLSKLFQPDQWIIRKEIFYIIWSFLMISIFNYSYNTIIGKDIAPYHNFLEFFGITVAVGIFPLFGLIYVTEKYQNKRNNILAETLSNTLHSNKNNSYADKSIEIYPETLKSGPLKLYLKDFLFATSDNNYSTIFFVIEGKLNRKLLRLSIKSLEIQLLEFQNVIRCHRSFIVNKEKIIAIKGNARSLTLKLELYPEYIPVSRSFNKEKLI